MQDSLSEKKLIAIYVCLWLIWSGIHAFILNYSGFSWMISITDSAASNILLAAFCFAAVNIIHYYQPEKNYSINMIPWGLALSGLWLIIINYTLKYFFSSENEYMIFFNKSMPIRFFISFLIIIWAILLKWILKNLDSQREFTFRNNEIQQTAREAELHMLRYRLQPHFLFNSLNSISALSGNINARKMIQLLSDFLRSTLKNEENEIRSFEEELNHIKLYFEIEKVRFNDRLQVSYNINENTKSKLLPSLILQPIVENAVKYGLYGTIDKVNIQIHAETDEKFLTISTENPIDDDYSPTKKGEGFGLKSVERRLQLIYLRSDLLSIIKEINKYIITIKIPCT